MLFEVIFLTLKYLIETAALCFLLTLCLTRRGAESFKKLLRASWLLCLSALAQIVTHYVFDAYLPALNFTFRYIIWNLLTMWGYWALQLRERWHISSVLISFLLISDQFCQMFATFIIFAWRHYLTNVTQFGVADRLISTAIIWSCFCGICFFTYHSTRKIHDTSPRSTLWVNTFCWCFFLIGWLLSRFYLHSQAFPMITVAVFFLFISEMCLFFAIAMLMVREQTQAVEQARLNQQYIFQLHHVDEQKALYQELRQLRHEMKNQRLYIAHLLEEHRYEELRDYFHGEETEAIREVYDCGNRLVNSILWTKLHAAEQANIPMQINAALPEELPIRGHHLCSILVNLLDNALEASKTVKKPEIQILLKMQRNYFFCCVSNRVESNILLENPTLRTTKRDHLEHGFGIQNVKLIAQMYHGMTDFAVENGYFVATVMLACDGPA